MNKNRLEAFSDAVVAIVITIMVLELKVPHDTSWSALAETAPLLCSYLLSFIYIGIYWVNHHHLLQAVRGVNGAILWANLHLLFWLSLIPFVTGWVGHQPLASLPLAMYGVVLLMCSLAFRLLFQLLLAREGPDSPLALAMGRSHKNELSIVLYALAIPLAMWQAAAAAGVYVLLALLWFVPERRIENLRWS